MSNDECEAILKEINALTVRPIPNLFSSDVTQKIYEARAEEHNSLLNQIAVIISDHNDLFKS